MKFGWLHAEVSNKSLLNIIKNVTEYVTVELLSRGFEVNYCYSIEEAEHNDMYATIGTLFDDKLYKDPVHSVDNSDYILLSPKTLYDNIGFINTMLSPYKHFVGNTENLFHTCKDTNKIYDLCVCTAGGVTPLIVHNYVNLTSDATIIVVDYSNVALGMSEKIVNSWDMVEDLNNFIDRNKLIDDPYVYLGKYQDNGSILKKNSDYKFLYVDLFDKDSIRKCLSHIENGTTGLWLASNIFNYITTSLLYDVDLRHSKQIDFIELLSTHSVDWDVGLVTSGSGTFLSNAKDLLTVKVYKDLDILPWRSLG
jgi:hypothetical protein